MAQRYVEQAQAQLNPLYDQQAATMSAQIPAIQQLYSTLMQGLESSGQAQNQQILESAGSRGLTRSSIPVDLQTGLAQSLTQERGKLGAQQAGEIAGIQSKMGDLNIQRAQAITQLADSLQGRDLKEREFQMNQQAQERDYQLKVKQMNMSARSAVEKGAPAGLVNSIYTRFQKGIGKKDGFVSPNVFKDQMMQWVKAGGAPSSFIDTFGSYINPVHQKKFGGYY